jgi:nesprin-1
LWKEFDQRLKRLESWIDQAQQLVQEKDNDDFVYLIEKHKNFFQLLDEEILHGFLKAGRELLHHRDREQKEEIERLMDHLQSQWKTIVSDAPVRLLRLQYERVEHLIGKELKRAEEELSEELKLFEEQQQRGDCAEILRRHNEHFQWNHFEATIERHLQQLLGIVDDLHSKDTDTHSREQIDQRTTRLKDYWTRMKNNIGQMKRKLQTIPKQWQEFEEK